jgi:hypothetical protein
VATGSSRRSSSPTTSGRYLIPPSSRATSSIGGVAKDNLGVSGTDFGVGDAAHTLTGAGAGGTAALVCTTTASSGTYRAISFTAIQVSSIS